MNNVVARTVAAQIARDLFTNGMGQRAGRLVLEPPDKRIDGGLGGWSETALAHRIAELLGVPPGRFFHIGKPKRLPGESRSHEAKK
jgi:hypothetical protein